MSDVRQWLGKYGLSELAEVFNRERIDLDAARTLAEADITELGLPLGLRSKLRAAIQALQSVAAPVSTVVATAVVSPQAERRQLTILFCDLVGSTALSRQLDPERLRELMQSYQQACRTVIEKYEGHVAQYLGDGLMVYFGWPRAHEDDAERAVRSAFELIDVVKSVPAPAALQVRIGIATGSVVVGETGAGDASVPKLAVGETPNLAARLQGLAGPDQIVIAPSTQRLAGGAFTYSALGPQLLKGILEAVQPFRVTGSGKAEGRFDAAHGQAALTPLVGRDSELALMQERWAQVLAGEGQLVLLSGEPGIGKSRVTQALRQRIEGQAHLRMRYQCSPYHTRSALYPMVEHLERSASFLREDSPSLKIEKLETLLRPGGQDLAAVVPLFAALLSLPAEKYPALNFSPQKQKEKLLEALVEQIGSLARTQPVLMVFEDAHWVDPTTQEALDLLVSRIARWRVLLLITHRPEYAAPWSGEAHVSAVTLNRFNPRLGALMAEKVTGGKPLPAEVIEQIVAKTDGIPLFVEELTKYVIEAGFLKDTGTRYELDGPLPPLAIPSTLHDSLMARLDRLAPVKEVAQVGACIGREFSHELLAAISPMNERDLGEALKQLVLSQLVYQQGAAPQATYTFKHALVQDAAYGSLLKSRRQQLHQRIAQTLEQRFPERVANEPEVVAHHYTEAGLWDKAIPAWHQAGQAAFLASAYAEAIANATKGIGLLKYVEDDSARATMELKLQTLLGLSYQNTLGFGAHQTGNALRRAEELLPHASSTVEAASILAVKAVHHWAKDSLPLAAEYYERAWQVAVDGGDTGPAVFCRGMHGAALFHNGRGSFGITLLEEALAVYDRAEHRDLALQFMGMDVEATITEWLGLTYGSLGYFDKGRAAQQKAVEIARQGGHPFTVGQTTTWYAYGSYYLRDHQTALDLAEKACSYCEDQNVAFWFHVSLIQRGYERIVHHNVDAGLDDLHRALKFATDTGSGYVATWAKVVLADAHLVLGDLDATEQIISQVKPHIREAFGINGMPMVLRMEAKVDVIRNQANGSKAEGLLISALEISREQDSRLDELRTSLALARLWNMRGQHKRAFDLLAPVYEWFSEGFDLPDLKDAKALLEQMKQTS